MGFQVLGQGVQGFLDAGFVGRSLVAPGMQAAEEGMAEPVGGKDAVQVTALYPAVHG